MLKNHRLEERGNAKKIEVTNIEALSSFIKFEEIANYLTCKPDEIYVTIEDNEESYLFNQIFRIREWLLNSKTEAWCIYVEDKFLSDNVENLGGIVLRHIFWDREDDVKKYKNLQGEERKRFLSVGPNIKAQTVYLNKSESINLIMLLKEFDIKWSSGILIKDRKRGKLLKWHCMEVFREFDMELINMKWSFSSGNKELEKDIKNIKKTFNNCIQKIQNESNMISKIELNHITT